MKSHLVLTILLSYLLLTTANQCSVSIIGSGLSGVYTAYRLATANETEYPPYEICLFDASREYGGRVLTVQDDQGDLFEMGIDSFDMGKNPLFSELVDYLGLDTDCLWEEAAETEVVVETEIEKEVTVVNETAPPPRDTEVTVVNETETETVPPREIEVNVNESAPVETAAEVEVEEVNVETEGQKRGGFFGYAGQDATETEAVEVEVDVDQNATAEEVEVKTGDVKTEPETKEIKTEESELRPEALTVPEEKKKKCSPGVIKLMLLRSKIVNKNSSAEELPYTLTQTVDKLKDLPTLAFDTVMGEYINTEELEQIRSDEDAASRWQKISSMIEEIKNGDIKYKDVPINQLDMSMVLIDTLNLSKEDIEASIYLSDKYPRLRHLMSMNFELFAIHHLRNIAAGEEDLRTIKSHNGLSTVHDIMVSELEDRGVQIYHNAKLDDVKIVGDTILLHFADINGVVPTNRVFFAISRKELQGLGGSDVLQQISEPARLLLGNLMPTHLVKGAVFYERAWWKDYDVGDVFLTDTSLNKLSFHTRSDCQEGAECAGWIKFEHWGEGDSFNYDIFNPIDMATVLSEFYRQGDEDIEVDVEAVEYTDTEVEAGTTEDRNPPTEGEPAEVEVEIEGNPKNESSKPPSEKSWEGKSEDRFGNESSRLFELVDTFQEREALRSQFVLSLIHRRFMDLFKNVPGFDPANIEPPVSILIANWANDGRYDFGTLSLPSSIKYKDAVLAMLEPIPGAAVHFVNPDFSEFTSWDHYLEGSIVMVERALNQALGLQKPEWIKDENIYKAVVEVQ